MEAIFWRYWKKSEDQLFCNTMSCKKCKSTYLDIEGRVAALSHTFRMIENPLFIIELESNTDSHYILIRRKEQLPWHKKIIPGSFYKFTHMKKDIIFKGKYDIEIFTTTQDSCISKTKEDDYEFFSIENVDECIELVSYKGVITSIVNKEAGIFKLDGKVLLVASFLMEVSSELVSENPASKEMSSSLFCVGDKLEIYKAHLLKGREGLHTLVCCGRSLIRNHREFSPVYNFWKSNCGILHCLHVFNFGLSFLYWLCDLETFFLNVLFKNERPQEKIKSCQWKGKKGLVWKYVEEQLKDCEKRCRSLLLEFLLSDHSCILKQFAE
ncbi:hypothetical protein Anas_02702 [Armadillidium nasatum]|uniref:CST complex subunit CTC1 n=1 Tax=Armadillidium nasatum TaxID=96803 RepID=A0A5N5T039_9CRUS|nr:hypothetical protein Anas_02702 [Armadillidium nasatum]